MAFTFCPMTVYCSWMSFIVSCALLLQAGVTCQQQLGIISDLKLEFAIKTK